MGIEITWTTAAYAAQFIGIVLFWGIAYLVISKVIWHSEDRNDEMATLGLRFTVGYFWYLLFVPLLIVAWGMFHASGYFVWEFARWGTVGVAVYAVLLVVVAKKFLKSD